MKTPLEWLLEKDNPSVRYFALKHLLERADDDADAQAAQRAIMRSEPIKKILAAQEPEGYWAKSGSAYWPSYRTTAWQVLFLAELGASGRNRQARRGCEYLLKHAQAMHGGLSMLPNAAPRGVMYCHSGNLVWALIALGYDDDERIGRAIDWLVGAILGEDYASSTSGPGFCCAANNRQPCAWGAVKALRALTHVPAQWQTTRVTQATDMTVEFLLSHDLAKADYPYTERVNSSWFKFGFPLSYTSDVLEAALALCEAGYARDPRLQQAIDLVRAKRTTDGRWLMQRSLNGKMWADIETKGQPSKWVTLRALRVLKVAERV